MSIAAWMVDTISIASVTGVATSGKPTYGSPRQIKARVDLSDRILRTPAGDEKRSTHRIYSLDEIKLTDRIWLPGANTATVEGSLTPIALVAANDKPGTRTLYRADL